MNEFYRVDTSSYSDDKFACCESSEDVQYLSDYPRCPKCGAGIGYSYLAEPRKVILSRPKYGDFTSGIELLVSERVKEAYEKSDLKGIKRFIPVEVCKVRHIRKDPPLPPKYYSLELGYSFARVDLEKSVIIGKHVDRFCELCNPTSSTKDKIDGIYIDDSNWGGEDIFHLHEMGSCIYVSQRFVDFCLVNEFTNFLYMNTRELKLGYFG